MPGDLIVNARFATRQPSGVDRVANELTKAILSLQGDGSALGARIPNADPVTPLPVAYGRGFLTGHLWEQLELPIGLSGKWLLSPCNTGPISISKQIVIIHDAQTFLEPAAYSKAFRAWYSTLLPVLARRARIVVTISDYSREALVRFGVVPAGKAHVVPNGADHILSITADGGTLQRHGLRPSDYLLAIGNLSPHKNLAMLMRAAAARPAGAPELVVAGGGNSRVFADAGLTPPPGVRMLGRVTDAELRELYENALGFLFPSLTEGFGLPPLEAMLCGCPTIVSTAGAIPEVCGSASTYVAPNNETGWTQAMIEMSNSPDQRYRRIEAGRKHALAFTWKRSAQMLLALVDAENSRDGR